MKDEIFNNTYIRILLVIVSFLVGFGVGYIAHSFLTG